MHIDCFFEYSDAIVENFLDGCNRMIPYPRYWQRETSSPHFRFNRDQTVELAIDTRIEILHHRQPLFKRNEGWDSLVDYCRLDMNRHGRIRCWFRCNTLARFLLFAFNGNMKATSIWVKRHEEWIQIFCIDLKLNMTSSRVKRPQRKCLNVQREKELVNSDELEIVEPRQDCLYWKQCTWTNCTRNAKWRHDWDIKKKEQSKCKQQ
jgi:hypothetical protein